MVNRRTFVFGTVGTALTSLLAGCSQAAEDALKVTILQGSIPAEVLQSFRRQSETPVDFQLLGQIKTTFQQLQRWQQSSDSEGFSLRQFLPWMQADSAAQPDNLVSLGDYWLEAAITQNLIAPLEIDDEILEQLPLAWQQFVRRDELGQIETTVESSQSSLWAAPYKVQTLVIVYRQSFFPTSPADNPPFKTWRDLLQPQLRQQVALPDHPRLVIGLLQKIQDGSFNLPIESEIALSQLRQQLEAPFAALNAQVKTYDSTNSLKALVNEDIKAAVVWSGEAVSALRRYQDLRVVVPEEGSLLSADLWVRPLGAAMTDAAKRWIDFCWQDGPATQISAAGRGISPVFLAEGAQMPAAIAESQLPSAAIRNSEPLLPIPKALQTAYFDIWQTLRTNRNT